MALELRRRVRLREAVDARRVRHGDARYLGAVDVRVEGVVRERVEVAGEALVHPSVAALVRAHDHRKPVVAQLVVDHAEEAHVARADAREVQHRVLHAAHHAGDRDGDGVGVGEPARVVEDGGAAVARRFLPAGLGFGADALVRVGAHDEYVVHRAIVLQDGGVGGVHDEGVRGSPGHVTNVLGAVAPRLRGGAARRGARANLVRGDDVDAVFGLPGAHQAAALFVGVDLAGVEQRARGDHLHGARHGER